MARRTTVSVICALALLVPSRARAQEPLSQLLVQLIQADVRLAPPAPGFSNHETHFEPGTNQTLAPYLFNQQLLSQLGTFPIGSPAGGFSFTFDPSSGTFQRATDSFGPSFSDRALTNGRGKLTIGTTFQYSKYNSFEGKSLTNGDVKFYLQHEDVPGNNFFEGDLIEADLKLNVSNATTTFFLDYGITDALDLAVAVPIVHVSMDATVDATILRLATAGIPGIHSFTNGTDKQSFPSSGSASGIGDLIVRAKYRFLPMPGGGVAAGVELRLPTGDENNLLGTGAPAATFSVIGSTSRGSLSPHFNVAFTGAGSSDAVDIPNEFGFKVGTEFVNNPKVTWTADLLGRSLLSTDRLELTNTTHNFFNSAGVPGSVTLQEYVAHHGSLNLLDLALGGKFNVSGKLLINANVLVALTNSGVTARFTPVFGFDYSF